MLIVCVLIISIILFIYSLIHYPVATTIIASFIILVIIIKGISDSDKVEHKTNKLISNVDKFKANVFNANPAPNYEKVKIMINNFVADNLDLLSCVEIIRSIELFLYEKSPYGSSLLQISSYKKSILTYSNNVIANYFQPLVTAISKYVDFDNDVDSNYGVYALLRESFIQTYSEYWVRQYEPRFSIEKADIDHIFKRISLYKGIKNESKCISSLAYYLIKHNLVSNKNYFDIVEMINVNIDKYSELIKQEEFEKSLLSPKNATTPILSISDIDLMSGVEFEYFISTLFDNMGYFTSITKASGDQGIDIIATKDGRKIGIQAKCYSGVVSNKAVQEVVAAKQYYKADKIMVVTNSKFTKSAIELAKANDVTLWDRAVLIEKMKNMELSSVV